MAYVEGETFAQWFVDQGVGVFPIKERSKEPACKSWDDFVCTREQAGRLKNYGVILSNTLGVVDTDEDASELWVCANLPRTPFMVKGARGLHRYYRLLRPTPKFIHRDGLTIEFRNAGQYVVGPGSIHPTGVTYEASAWTWDLKDVPIFPEFVFDDRPGATPEGGHVLAGGLAFEFPETVFAGERHDALYKLLRSMKALGSDKDSGWELIKLANANRCMPPLSEGADLRRWFNRGWDTPDRPIERVLPALKSVGVEEV